jgi:GxxExxY protein
MAAVELKFEELTQRIIGAAIAVHRALGPGFLESIYEKALCVELSRLGIPFSCQAEVPIWYEGVEVGRHKLDLLAFDTIVVELKAVKSLEHVHFATLRSYLKAAGKQVGLIMNFNEPKLLVKRYVFGYGTDESSVISVSSVREEPGMYASDVQVSVEGNEPVIDPEASS